MARVEIYSSMFCGYCARAKALLERKGVAYEQYRCAGRHVAARRDGGARRRPAPPCRRSSSTALISAARTNSPPRPRRQARRAARTDDVSGSFTAACIQLTSAARSSPISPPPRTSSAAPRDRGAELIMTPEVSDMIEPRGALARSRRRGPKPTHADARRLPRARARDRGVAAARLDRGARGRRRAAANRSFLIAPDGAVAQRYDKIHMFDVPSRRRELSRIGGVPPGRGRGARRSAVGRARHDRVLRSALPASLSRPRAGGRRVPLDPVGLHRSDRPRALACAAARAGDREFLLRVRAGAMRRARRGAPHLRPFADRRALGRDSGGGRGRHRA